MPSSRHPSGPSPSYAILRPSTEQRIWPRSRLQIGVASLFLGCHFFWLPLGGEHARRRPWKRWAFLWLRLYHGWAFVGTLRAERLLDAWVRRRLFWLLATGVLFLGRELFWDLVLALFALFDDFFLGFLLSDAHFPSWLRFLFATSVLFFPAVAFLCRSWSIYLLLCGNRPRCYGQLSGLDAWCLRTHCSLRLDHPSQA